MRGKPTFLRKYLCNCRTVTKYIFGFYVCEGCQAGELRRGRGGGGDGGDGGDGRGRGEEGGLGVQAKSNSSRVVPTALSTSLEAKLSTQYRLLTASRERWGQKIDKINEEMDTRSAPKQMAQ